MRGADEGWSLAHLTGTRNVVLSHKRASVCVWGGMGGNYCTSTVSLAEYGFSLMCHGEPRKTYEVWTDGFRAVF